MSDKFSVTLEMYGQPAKQTLELATKYQYEHPNINFDEAVKKIVWQGYKQYLDLQNIIKAKAETKPFYIKITKDQIEIL